MADPATTTRGTPGGIKLPDGAFTKIAFSLDSDIEFYENTVTPPGMDGGEPVNHTTMHNTTYETFSPQKLIRMTPASTSALYDPCLYTAIVAILNKEGSITVTFPDGSTVDFFGYLQKFEPQTIQRGQPPTANITIMPTNYDPTNHLEVGPKVTSVAGT